MANEIDWKELAKELYDHLNYCGWGDSWERECSEELQDRAMRAFDSVSTGLSSSQSSSEDD